MLKNDNYNLIEEISVLSRGLARYEAYERDAKEFGCDNCAKLWEEVRVSSERLLGKLKEELVNHVKAGRFV